MARPIRHKPYQRKASGVKDVLYGIEDYKLKPNLNGECRVVKPADPDKLAAYREQKEELRKKRKKEREERMGKVKTLLMEQTEDDMQNNEEENKS